MLYRRNSRKEAMRILSGMRPTGSLHIGHLVGTLMNWIEFQTEKECLFMVADYHALMSEYKSPKMIKKNSIEMIKDWMAVGISPYSSIIFLQSGVKEHLELFMILSCLTPLSWLERSPTFKDQVKELRDKEIANYGFLGYPILQTADIILYKAHRVPVGSDQLPHLELAREIIRRFHFLYQTQIFPEPQPILSQAPKLLGLDGRKMSKSYNNYIGLTESDDQIRKKIMNMFTDPQRVRFSDPGHPEICNVFTYYSVFKKEIQREVEEWCVRAKKGCTECKKILAEILIEYLKPIKEKRKEFTDTYVKKVLKEGTEKAREIAQITMKEVKNVMGL